MPGTEPTNEDIARALGWVPCVDRLPHPPVYWHPGGLCDEYDLGRAKFLPDFATAEGCDRWIIPDIERRGWDWSILTVAGKSEANVYTKGFMESIIEDDIPSLADTPWRALVLAWFRAVEGEKA